MTPKTLAEHGEKVAQLMANVARGLSGNPLSSMAWQMISMDLREASEHARCISEKLSDLVERAGC